jgi:GWxTD domain-containing protein
VRKLLAIAVLLLAATAASADTVRDSVVKGRALLDQGDYDGAIQTLQKAVPAATELTSESERYQALSAIHFYTALAFHKLRNEAKTRESLQEFFLFSPGAAKLDPSKYDRAFIRLFDDVSAKVIREGDTAFDRMYPGYREFSTAKPRPRPIHEWGMSPEFELLATDAERSQWKGLRDDADRTAFVESFWTRRNPATRAEWDARVAFADYTFGTEQVRGSLSDRGRVFILLGKPRVVRKKNLTRAEGATIPFSTRKLIDGTVERWYFFPDQLPEGVPAREVEFKFITQEGYGESVLQREVFALKALAQAQKNRS